MFRYKLRTLLIVSAIAPPLLAIGPLIVGRAAHYQRRATIHDEQAEIIASKLCPPEDRAGTNTPRYMWEYGEHRKLAKAYRTAAWKPWVFIGEPSLQKYPPNARNNIVRGPLGGVFDDLPSPIQPGARQDNLEESKP